MDTLGERQSDRVTIVYDPSLASYDFGPDHPLQPCRHMLTVSLLRALGWLDGPLVFFETPRPATVTELLAVHSYPYIQAVQYAQEIAQGAKPPRSLAIYGLGTEDDPLFAAMYDAPALYTGATLQAMRTILENRADHAYSPAGGMHHAMKARAAGFCVFNDAAAAIALALGEGRRVAYVDLDAHHGDGVQSLFYEEPRVLFISVHESGHYLFPGTGEIEETGTGAGYATSLNVPLPPFADDRAFLAAMDRVVAPALRAFCPDILVTQTGCDTHHDDPLTDLNATLSLYPQLAERLHCLAHETCAGRWLILGGGGYDPADVTPRAWSAFIGTVLGQDTTSVRLPAAWRDESRAHGGNPPHFLLDDTLPAAKVVPERTIADLLDRIERTALARLKERMGREGPR